MVLNVGTLGNQLTQKFNTGTQQKLNNTQNENLFNFPLNNNEQRQFNEGDQMLLAETKLERCLNAANQDGGISSAEASACNVWTNSGGSSNQMPTNVAPNDSDGICQVYENPCSNPWRAPNPLNGESVRWDPSSPNHPDNKK